MNARLRRVLMRARCAVIGHNDVKAHFKHQLVAACTDCLRVTEGIDVRPHGPCATKPENWLMWRAYWLDRIQKLSVAEKAGAV